MWAIIGCAWTYLAVFISLNRGWLETQILSKFLPNVNRDLVMGLLAAALAYSVIMLVFHIARGLLRARRYYNSGAILLGFALGMALHFVPGSVYSKAFDLLNDDTQAVITKTAGNFQDIDWNSLRMVSSQTEE